MKFRMSETDRKSLKDLQWTHIGFKVESSPSWFTKPKEVPAAAAPDSTPWFRNPPSEVRELFSRYLLHLRSTIPFSRKCALPLAANAMIIASHAAELSSQ